MKRILYDQILKHLNKTEFTIITGARQTGKSTLLKQVGDFCKEKNKPVLFLNLENRDIRNELDRSPVNLLKFLPDTDKKIIVCIDEVQYLSDPSNFLKLIYDEYKDKIKIIATGSSAFYIDRKFNDSLAGRKHIFFLPTCSFEEYLMFCRADDFLEELHQIKKRKSYKSLKLPMLEKAYSDYITHGGYPAVILEKSAKEKKRILTDLRDSFLKKDILESGVKNEFEFYNLFRILASQVGNLLNVNELSKTLKIKHETVENYLYILQKCFHIALIKPYSKNIRNELTKMSKVFLMDTGMMNILTNNFQPLDEKINKGNYWENIYFRRIAESYGAHNINFWRTTNGNEVDFIIQETGNPLRAVEVKYSCEKFSEAKYKKFRSDYPEIKLDFVSYEPFTEDFFRSN
ncbi:MAG: ATP-binding protein [Bacteroidales bacterium]|jgi:predicted AAA+ superfamily ATPase|nr:ATP-binding protein [Bacteroidales bacterium]